MLHGLQATDFSSLPTLPAVFLTLSSLLSFHGTVFTEVSLSFCTQIIPSPFLHTGRLFCGSKRIATKQYIS